VLNDRNVANYRALAADIQIRLYDLLQHRQLYYGLSWLNQDAPYNLALKLLQRDKLAEACQHLQRAVDQQQKAVGLDPGNSQYRSLLASLYGVLSARLGKQLDDPYRAAFYMACRVDLVEKDAKLDEKDKRKKLTSYVK